jgi:hypothetical protein
VEYREKNDDTLCRLEWNTKKDLFFHMWNVENYRFDGRDPGTISPAALITGF